MSGNSLTYYLFDHLPGSWPGWTLAVLAVSERDARNYVKAWHKGGTLAGTATSGTVKAHCGAVTEDAQKKLAIQKQSSV
jgi:hypothetical protein